MVVSAMEEQIKQPEVPDSCEVPPDLMRIVNINTRTGKWDSLVKK